MLIFIKIIEHFPPNRRNDKIAVTNGQVAESVSLSIL